MHLRPFKPQDTSDCVTLAVAGFLPDDVYAWTHPNRHTHPLSFRFHRLLHLRRTLSNPANYMMLCVSDCEDGELHSPTWMPQPTPSAALDPESQAAKQDNGNADTCWNGHERILGYAIWRGVDLSNRKPSLFARLESTLRQIEDKFYSFLPDPSSSPTNHARFMSHIRTTPDAFAVLPSKKFHLSELVTAPSVQRRGVGTKLLEWGLQIAHYREVPVSLIASKLGRPLYEKLGFVVIDWPELRIGGGGARMVWEGEGREGVWVQKGRRVVVRGGKEVVVDGRTIGAVEKGGEAQEVNESVV